MVHIRLEQLSKQLGETIVLDQLNLELGGGQIVALLGANGAGKTTLLHLLGGLYQPTSGRVLLDAEELSRQRMDQRRRLHYLPDIPTLSPAQTPLDYIVFAVEAYGLTGPDSDQRILDLLAEFDLLPVADSPSRVLSRGQRYKATLAAMLAVDPELWILDEPFTSGMDPLGLTALRKHFAAAKQRGRLVIYSTQLIEIAQQMSDQICVLSKSSIMALDQSKALLADEGNRELESLLHQLRNSPVRNSTMQEVGNEKTGRLS